MVLELRILTPPLGSALVLMGEHCQFMSTLYSVWKLMTTGTLQRWKEFSSFISMFLIAKPSLSSLAGEILVLALLQSSTASSLHRVTI